ncbi:glycoside hydrolase family 16 protein [Falsiroseomonas sp.]|uniref:glycoside hydrolase family 16 protein n=1 Tax=Falsiroseomonas sp. TaxID=2870721 RepID=UPI003565437D
MSDFTQVFRDDFEGSSLDRGTWKALYSGQYGNGMFRWDPGQVEVGDGKLTIATERDGGSWVSGGLSTIPDGQTYGSYEFSARIDPGQGTAAAILLWPSDGQWTDEVDIVETHDPQRNSFAFSKHGDPNVTEYIDVNVADWHTYRLDWTPNELKLYVDGQEKATMTGDIPAQPMSFSMQGQVMAPHETWFGGGPDGSTPGRVEVEVDWVKVSAWTPGAGTEPAAAAEPAFEPASAGAAAPDDFWLAAAARYVENDGEWEGSWRNQVADGQISLEDVAGWLQAGLGQTELWQ